MVSKYFDAHELVDKEVYDLLGDYSINLFDYSLIETIDAIREILDVPLICNDWKWGGSMSQRGFRSNKSTTGSAKSYHKRGMAVDLSSKKMSAKEMRSKLEANKDRLPYPIRIEKWDKNGELNWLHVDLGDTKGETILFFKG